MFGLQSALMGGVTREVPSDQAFDSKNLDEGSPVAYTEDVFVDSDRPKDLGPAPVTVKNNFAGKSGWLNTASNFVSNLEYATPVWGALKMANDFYYQGNYVGWVGMSGLAAFEAITLGEGALVRGSLFGGAKAASSTAVSATTKAGTVVLGKYPEYTKLATQLGAKRFNIPTKIWNSMTPAQQWGANLKFLDRAIASGDNFVLATKVVDINKVTGYYKKELDYLISKGYKLGKDGLKMVK